MDVSCNGRVEIRNNVVVNLISVVSPTYNGGGKVHNARRREGWALLQNKKTEVRYEQDHHEVG